MPGGAQATFGSTRKAGTSLAEEQIHIGQVNNLLIHTSLLVLDILNNKQTNPWDINYLDMSHG